MDGLQIFVLTGCICGAMILIVVIVIIAGSKQERNKTMENNTTITGSEYKYIEPKKAFDFKKFGHELVIRIQRMGFWALVLIALGCFIGIYYSKIYYNSSIEDGIKMQRIIHAGKVYDVTISPINQR